MTTLELKGRGITKVCTDLAGRNHYLVTEAAQRALVVRHDCRYENGNGQMVKM